MNSIYVYKVRQTLTASSLVSRRLPLPLEVGRHVASLQMFVAFHHEVHFQ